MKGNFLNIYIKRRIKAEPLPATYSKKGTELTRWSGVLIEYLTVSQLVKRSLAFYGIPKDTTVITFRHLSLF